MALDFFQLVVCFAFPALLMIVCYSVVIKELWKSNKNMSILANANKKRETKLVSNKKQCTSLQGYVSSKIFEIESLSKFFPVFKPSL